MIVLEGRPGNSVNDRVHANFMKERVRIGRVVPASVGYFFRMDGKRKDRGPGRVRFQLPLDSRPGSVSCCSQMRVRSTILVIAFVFAGAACRGTLMSREDVRTVNQNLDTQVYRALKDIRAAGDDRDSGDVVFKKGDKLRLWVEAGGDWVRVKAFGAAENREQARGRTIVYLFRQDQEEDADIWAAVNGKIKEKAVPEVQK